MKSPRRWGGLIREKLSDRFYQISIKQRVLFSFILLITLSISAMGLLTYRIAGKEIQNNAFETSRETVDKTMQLLDYRLNDVAMSVQSLMLSDAYRQMMIDVQAHDVKNYYVHLSEMQYVLSQATFNEPIIENVLIATPIGDFYSTTQVRAQDHSFYGSELYDNSKKIPAVIGPKPITTGCLQATSVSFLLWCGEYMSIRRLRMCSSSSTSGRTGLRRC